MEKQKSMEKHLKDYAPFYLGQEVQIEGATLDKVIIGPTFKRTLTISLLQEYDSDLYRMKLILRDISDMTEDECIMANSLSGDGALTEDEDLKLYYTRKAVFFEPEEFAYLLKIGIDLFGLIKAGLALDKTKYQS